MQGNKNIIHTLNKLLAGELTAVDQYLIHGEMYADMGLYKLSEKSLHESAHEREHATALIQRILFLEGKPDLSKREGLNVGHSATAMLESDLAVEYKSEGFYGDLIEIKISAGEISALSFELFYQLSVKRNDQSVILVLAKTGMVCYDYDAKKVKPIPEKFKKVLLQQ